MADKPKRAKIKGSAKFNRILADTMKYEGWNEKEGSYGGFMQNTYDDYRKSMDLPPRTVKEITFGEARDIAKSNYWDHLKLDKLDNENVKRHIFDHTFQFGPDSTNGGKRAIMELQKMLGVKEDGILGPKTNKALNKYTETSGEEPLLSGLRALREPTYGGRTEWLSNQYLQPRQGVR